MSNLQNGTKSGFAQRFGGFGRDLRVAFRALAKAPTFSLVCTVSLGIGLGVVFAISLFLGMLTATPAGVDPDGLVEVLVRPLGPLRAKQGDWAIETWSYPDFEDLRDADTGMAVVGWAVDDAILGSSSMAPQPVSAMYASLDYFSQVGVLPAQGRFFSAAWDDQSRDEPVIVVSHRLWINQLGGDPDVVGSKLTLNRVEHVVLGIAPDGFRGHFRSRGSRQADVWVPFREHPALDPAAGVGSSRTEGWVRILGRLTPGTSVTTADASVSSLMAGLAEQYPDSNENKSATVVPYTSTSANRQITIAVVTAMFYGMSLIVLLIVCLNVAGMVLVRSTTREHELGIRQALGASRIRLIRHLMSESVILALAGGAVSMLVVSSGFSALAWWFEGPLPDELRLTLSRAGFCLALSLGTTLVFGLAPAIRFSRGPMVRAIKDDARAGTGRVGRVHRLAAALQVGLALPFLVLGGLLFQGARETATADLGFQPDGLFASRMNVAAAGYSDDEARAFFRNVKENLRRAAGVESVTLADGLPLDYNQRRNRVSRSGEESYVVAHTTRVGEGYFETVGTSLLRGREFTRADDVGSELVTVLSESLARRLFPDREALGQQVASSLQGHEMQVFTVVGITADAATSQMQTERPQIFIPLAQHPAPRVYLVARSSVDTRSMASAFEEAIVDLDPSFSRPTLITGVGLVRDNISDLLQQSTLSIAVASVALLLSALGIYGVVAFMVASRTREMGVRIALGATRGRILQAILIDTCKLALPGLIVGLGLSIVAVRQTNLLWYRLGGVEPVAYALAIGAALAVALLASMPSAHRAATVDPLNAIRAK